MVDLPPGVRPVFLDKAGAMPALSVATSRCEALVALQGAQLLSFTPAGGRPLLWLSDRAVYEPGKAIRGGIPLCFPWFGAHPSDATQPAHGFARNRAWTLDDARQDEDDIITLSFSLANEEPRHPGWPHGFRAGLHLRLADDIRVTLEVCNDDDAMHGFTFALHSYFPVVDIRRARVDGLGETIRFDGEYDRVFNGAAGDYRIVDEAAGRAIAVSSPDCASAVVWNPWLDKTARLADLAPDAWQRFLCVECGNIGRDAVTLGAGERRRFDMRIVAAD